MPEPESPKRLILTGDEPVARETPRLVLPGDAAATSAGEAAPAPGTSRIILPPGVSITTDEDVPEYPKLRPLIILPISDGQREMLLVQDPLGVIQGQPMLGIESLGLLQLLDGSVSLTDLSAALMRESKDLRVANMVRDFVGKLDQMFMLDSPRFHTAWQELRDAYHPLEVRPAALEGRSYPAAPDALRVFLDEHFATATTWRATDGVVATATPVRALMAPHLDPRRAGPAMARAFLELDSTPATEPLRVVVFGTGHALVGDLFALTRKHFETPLGKVTCDTAFVDAVAAPLGEAAYRSELAHRDEHSIEFQALYLRHRLGDRVRIVPILCGGFHTLLDQGVTPREVPEFEALIQAVRNATSAAGGRTVYLAGVDLSHVGPRFGDPVSDESAHTEVEAIDREALDAAATGNADAWFAAIARHDDATRICGFAPIYAALRCAEPGPGRLLRYERSDEEDSSFVTIASMAW